MGSTKLTYTDYCDNIDYWKGEKGLDLPKWADEIAEKGCKPVCAIDFYADLFGEHLEEHRKPEDYTVGEYGAIAVEIITVDAEKKKTQGKRTTITRGNVELHELIDRSENFCMVAPISYAGRNRTITNARQMFALAIEIDEIQPKNGIDELFYSWQRTEYPLPKPTYIVCSGNGVHLYYVFREPIDLFTNIYKKMSKIKWYLTPLLWNKYITKLHEKKQIQWESLNQPFRCVGTRGKSPCLAMAFEVGEKITLDYLNGFLPEQLQIKDVYSKGKVSLEEAKELYPEWYQTRIVEKKPAMGHWNRHEGIYKNWIEKIKNGAVVGKRYNCLENLCSLAVQCGIDREQVERDCKEVAEKFEKMTVSEDNHFTEHDINSALKTYYRRPEKAYKRKLEDISAKTGIELQRNKRNGRKRKEHLQAETWINEKGRPITNICKQNRELALQFMRENGEIKGRPTAEEKVKAWRAEHPDGKPKECINDTGLSKNTVYKWWTD